MRRIALAALLVVFVVRETAAQGLCTPHPNDFFGQGGAGTAGWALVNSMVLAAPQNFYLQGYPDRQAALNASYVESLKYAQAVVSVVQRQATTFPTGSSLGGFTYSFDPKIGLPVRRSQSFGPMFADRPQSSGARTLSVAIAGQLTWWQSLGGVDLARGLTSIRAYPASVTDTGDPETQYSRTQISFATARGSLGVNYGLTRRVDVGVLLSYGSAAVDSVLDFTLTDMTTGVVKVDGRHMCGLSRAIGDTSLRAKVEFLSRPSVDLALGVEVRLPTGVADEVMGVGATQAKVTLIGALPMGVFSPHFNLGYTHVAGSTAGFNVNSVDVPPLKNSGEFNYTIGADVAVSDRFTLAGDVIGRTLLNSFTFVPTIEPLVSQLSIKPGNVHLVVGALGGKLLVRSGWLLNMSVAFPLTNGGLKPGITPVLGLERAF